MAPIWFFEEVNLYKILCPHLVPDMKVKHTFHQFKKDQFIYLNNDPSTQVYLVAKGRVKIATQTEEGKEVLKAILGEGEIFGELALVGQSQRTDFAQAMEEGTSICPMSISDMEELMAQNKRLSLQIYKILGFRLQKLERKIESLVFKDSRTRVIEFLHDWAEEKGQKVGFETKIKNYLTHKDIANLTGTSRQTVTTIMNELKERNLINFDRKQILIRDMKLLKKEMLQPTNIK
jgi:CRP/FNR family transcriptional regulator, cyclic AMP receptor protein